MKIHIISKEGLVQAAIRYIVDNMENIELLGQSTSLKAADIAHADILFIDIDSANDCSPENIALLSGQFPSLSTIFMAEAKDTQQIIKYLQLGPKGFVTKKCSEQEICHTLLSVSNSQKFYCNKVLDILMEHKIPQQEKILTLGTLTDREHQIVKMISKGMSTYEIADKLNLSHHTINTHRKNILKKWQISSPVELVLKAIEIGIID
jgi:DNA-binding NarL/FixJ family response regulator